jgi:phosphoribosylanthranilate isomerase
MVIKICGITNVGDALDALDAGADMLGFIFYPPSPRGVRIDAARAIVSEIRTRTLGNQPLRAIQLIGVFVDETAAAIAQTLNEVRLDAAQLSGHEPAESLLALNGRGYKVVRNAEEAAAYAPDTKSPAAQSSKPESRIPHTHADAALPDLLLEADHPTLYGGTGERVDVTLARQIAARHRILLAGGLTPINVASAIAAARPWGVDVASGVEQYRGKKDPLKVRAFIEQARLAQP